MDNGQLIGIGGVIVGAAIGIAGWLRNVKGDTTAQARWQGGIDYQLGDISKKLGKLDALDGLPAQMKGVDTRLCALESKFDRHLDEHRG